MARHFGEAMNQASFGEAKERIALVRAYASLFVSGFAFLFYGDVVQYKAYIANILLTNSNLIQVLITIIDE